MNITDTQEVEDPARLFLGKVVENNDPERLQRIKVAIEGRLQYDELPWIAPIAQSPFGIGSGYGSCRVPVVGSNVIVMFQGGSLYYGLLMGYPNMTAPPPMLATNYPKRYGFTDPIGNSFFVDMTAGSRAVEFHHASGAIQLKIEDSGACSLTSTQTVVVNTSSSATVTAGGGATINAETTVNGNVTINGNTTISGNTDVGGNATVVGTTTSTGAVTSAASVSAPTIVAATAMSVAGLDMGTHRHFESGSTGPTTGIPSP
jgi:hypothetical protein